MYLCDAMCHSVHSVSHDPSEIIVIFADLLLKIQLCITEITHIFFLIIIFHKMFSLFFNQINAAFKCRKCLVIYMYIYIPKFGTIVYSKLCTNPDPLYHLIFFLIA